MTELSLRNYQEQAKTAMLSRPFDLPHYLLADGPGTGKTPTTIVTAKEAGCKGGIILCPASIKLQWAKQMVKWGLAAEDEIQVVYGTRAKITSAPWVILNYALVREDFIREQLLKRSWHCLIEDEVHNLKNHTSQQTKAVYHRKDGIGHKCYWKWALSGTLMPNRPAELYPILATHFPQVLGKQDTWQKYRDYFCGELGKGARHVAELTERLQPVMLRRELQDVWKECPDVIENDVWLEVDYTKHPEWIGEGFMPEAVMRRVIAEAKIPQVVSYIDDRFNSGVDKLVVFTYHRSVTEGLHSQLSKYQPLKIYGGISPKQRELSLSKFIEDPQHRLIILQIMSAGEGIDGLQQVCAEYVHAEPEWCPGREDQAGRRILRLGQTRTVIETKLIAAGSFEEAIHSANQRKRKVIDVVLKPNGGSFIVSDHFEKSLETIARVFGKLEPLIDVIGPALQNAAKLDAANIAQVQQPSPLALVPNAAPTPQAPAAQTVAAPQETQLAANAPSANVAAPVVQAPAPVASAPAPAASNFAGFATREEFEKAVLGMFQPLGQDGLNKFFGLCQEFGVQRLSLLPDEKCAEFLTKAKFALAA